MTTPDAPSDARYAGMKTSHNSSPIASANRLAARTATLRRSPRTAFTMRRDRVARLADCQQPLRCGVLKPPIEPMLAKIAEAIPTADGYLFEPKWDGFRAIVFRSADDVFIQSRDLRPLDRYFPELHDALLERLPPNCVVDGEIVIVTPQGLDFDAL